MKGVGQIRDPNDNFWSYISEVRTQQQSEATQFPLSHGVST